MADQVSDGDITAPVAVEVDAADGARALGDGLGRHEHGLGGQGGGGSGGDGLVRGHGAGVLLMV